MSIIPFMRKFCLFLILIIVLVFAGCSNNNTTNKEYLRLHIRANSNESSDQQIKLSVRDELLNYLSPYFDNVTTRKGAEAVVKKHSERIEKLIDNFLSENKFDYKCNLAIKNENFPTRQYGELILEEGSYRAIIITLGTGSGDNWWCVAFPPLCFLEGDEAIYKSKIWEIIKE